MVALTPILAGTYDTSGYTQAVFCSGSYIYAADGTGDEALLIIQP